MFNLLAIALVSVTSANVSVSTLSNQTFSGTLIGVSPDEIVIDTGGEETAFSPDQLLRLAVQEPAKSNFEGQLLVELVDGSRIRATNYEVASGKALISIFDGKTIGVQAGEIRHVLLRSHDKPELQQQLQQILEEDLLGDAVVIRKEIEQPDGASYAELRPVEGVLFDVTGESVQFKFAGELRTVSRDKIDALLYYHPAGRELPQVLCRVDDIHGSQWQALSINLLGSDIHLVTPAGVEHVMPLTHVRSFDFAGGKIVFLSDLPLAAVRWRPFYGSSSPTQYAAKLNEPQIDRSFTGAKLAVLDEDQQRLEFEKGLAIRSHTSMLLILPDQFKRFVATVGLEPERGRSGNVRLQISGNGKLLVDSVIRGDEPARTIDIPIVGVSRLSITVGFGDNLTIGDYLHLCDAKVRK